MEEHGPPLRRRFLWTRMQFVLNSIGIVLLAIGLTFYALPRLWPDDHTRFLEANWEWLQIGCARLAGECPHEVLVFFAGETILSSLLCFEIMVALFALRILIWPVARWVMAYSPRYSSAALFVVTLLFSALVMIMLHAVPRWPEFAEFIKVWKFWIFFPFLTIVVLEMFLRRGTDDTRSIWDFLANLGVFTVGYGEFRVHGAMEPLVLFTVSSGVTLTLQFIWILRLFGGKQTREETTDH